MRPSSGNSIDSGGGAYPPNSRVRVTKGPLTGCVCVVVSMRSEHQVLLMLGTGVYMEAPLDWLELATRGGR